MRIEVWMQACSLLIHVPRAFDPATIDETGGVANDVGKFFQERVRHAYGIGFRATLERTAPFRVDLGFSEDGMKVSAGFGYSF